MQDKLKQDKLMNQKSLIIKMGTLARIYTWRSKQSGVNASLLDYYYEDYEKIFHDDIYESYEESIAPRSTNNGENMEGFTEFAHERYRDDMSTLCELHAKI